MQGINEAHHGSFTSPSVSSLHSSRLPPPPPRPAELNLPSAVVVDTTDDYITISGPGSSGGGGVRSLTTGRRLPMWRLAGDAPGDDHSSQRYASATLPLQPMNSRVDESSSGFGGRSIDHGLQGRAAVVGLTQQQGTSGGRPVVVGVASTSKTCRAPSSGSATSGKKMASPPIGTGSTDETESYCFRCASAGSISSTTKGVKVANGGFSRGNAGSIGTPGVSE